ncbi:MAG: S-layer homology domain-containing protein, partial [Oscillospiraceae bacterium]|nr:S-layer homology domain-containing protein [Oscillospiraceae bacterium]
EFAPPKPKNNRNAGRIDYDTDEKERPKVTKPTPIPSAVPESGVTITAETIGEVYGDVRETDWYAPGVAFVTAQGLMKGKGDTGTFAPNDATTRAEWVTILARLNADASANAVTEPWYQAVWDWATAEGITDGANPTASITREQLVTILWRYAGEPNAYVGGGVPDAPQSSGVPDAPQSSGVPDAPQSSGVPDAPQSRDLSGYTDSAQISDWARDAVAWAIERGILQGDERGLRPRDDVKRSEVAAILRRYLGG